MTQSLKIECLVTDLTLEGEVASFLVTKEQLTAGLSKKADLVDGKIQESNLPDFIANNLQTINQKLVTLEESIADGIQSAKDYSEAYANEKLIVKADLVDGKVPQIQLPSIEQYEGLSEALNGVLEQARRDMIERTDEIQRTKADLGEDGKVVREQLPNYAKIPGLETVVTDLYDSKANVDDVETSFKESQDQLDAHSLLLQSLGSILPYNPSNTYEEGYVTLKDGILQQLVSGDWVPFKINAINVVDASGESQQQVNYNGGSKWHYRDVGYQENERAVLDNGDIVKSAIDGNVNDPNVDMSGWVKTNSAGQIFDKTGVTQQDVNDSSLIKSPQLFGAKGGTNNDQVAFTNLSTDYAYALSKEYTVPVWRTQATKFIGNGTKVNLDSVNGDTTVCLQIKPNSNYSDIDFVNNPNQAKALTYSVIGNNSVLTNVGFYNFYDNAASKNSWGIYLENKENITLINPKFGGNGLSDIAILDNVKNITIVNAKNTVSSDGVHLDIEPNGSGNIENINIIGGKYSTINVLENHFLSIGIKSLNIIGANVKLLELRGGQTKIIGGKVEKIKGNWANALDYEGMQNEYFCGLEVDGFNLSENLFEDEFMNSLSSYDTNSYFSIYAPDGVRIFRKKDDNGYYLSINANKDKNYHILNQRGFTSLPLGADVICIAMAYSVENSGTDTMFQPCIIKFFNDSDVQVGAAYSLKGGRTAAGTTYNWSHEVSIFDIPSGATKCKITVRNNKTGSTLNVRKIGVHTLTKTDGAGNFNAVVASYALPNLKNSYKQAVVPVDKAYGYDGLLVETPDATYKYVGSGNTFTLQLVEKVKVFGNTSVNVSIPANTTHTETRTIAGAKVGQSVSLSPNTAIGSSVQLWGEVTAVGTVALYLRNTGATSASVVASLNIVLE